MLTYFRAAARLAAIQTASPGLAEALQSVMTTKIKVRPYGLYERLEKCQVRFDGETVVFQGLHSYADASDPGLCMEQMYDAYKVLLRAFPFWTHLRALADIPDLATHCFNLIFLGQWPTTFPQGQIEGLDVLASVRERLLVWDATLQRVVPLANSIYEAGFLDFTTPGTVLSLRIHEPLRDVRSNMPHPLAEVINQQLILGLNSHGYYDDLLYTFKEGKLQFHVWRNTAAAAGELLDLSLSENSRQRRLVESLQARVIVDASVNLGQYYQDHLRWQRFEFR